MNSKLETITQLVSGHMKAEVREGLRRRKREIEENLNDDAGEEIVKKIFKKKFEEIETRDSYEGVYEESFWDSWPKKMLPEKPEHWIDKDRLRKVARELNYRSWKMDALMRWLEEGADLGIERKESRMPTRGPNSKTAYQYGVRVIDAIREWVELGIAAGPFTEQEIMEMVEGGMEGIKIAPMSVTIKDNGKARICMNLSFPHTRQDEEIKEGVPASVNKGIDKRKFPAVMSTSRDIVDLLFKLGRGCSFAKIDWTSGRMEICRMGSQ